MKDKECGGKKDKIRKSESSKKVSEPLYSSAPNVLLSIF